MRTDQLGAVRDECSQNGMLMVALKVLLRVHAHMFEAMRKPHQGPSGLANWDIRQILQDQRKQVGASGSDHIMTMLSWICSSSIPVVLMLLGNDMSGSVNTEFHAIPDSRPSCHCLCCLDLAASNEQQNLSSPAGGMLLSSKPANMLLTNQISLDQVLRHMMLN